jgi:hypothetical protein
MEFGHSAPHAGTSHCDPIRPFRPDIAEAIALGEYDFMRPKSSFRRRAILMQMQRATRPC